MPSLQIHHDAPSIVSPLDRPFHSIWVSFDYASPPLHSAPTSWARWLSGDFTKSFSDFIKCRWFRPLSIQFLSTMMTRVISSRLLSSVADKSISSFCFLISGHIIGEGGWRRKNPFLPDQRRRSFSLGWLINFPTIFGRRNDSKQ